jgi:DNA-binding NtrC family response regulator
MERMIDMFHAIVVDDENSALKRFERIASNDPRIVIDGKFLYAEDAVAFIKEHPVDIAFLDIEMPEMNGLELLKQVEANYPSMVKLVLSGYAQITQVLATINQVSIFNFILKPWSIDELILILHKALDFYILQEENASYKALLETKNQSYQNILKRIDDVIDNAKNSAELLRIISDQILYFGRVFND